MKRVYQALAQRLRARNKSTGDLLLQGLHEAAVIEILRSMKLEGDGYRKPVTVDFNLSMRQHQVDRIELTVAYFHADEHGRGHWTDWLVTVVPSLTMDFDFIVERDGHNHESFIDFEGDFQAMMEGDLRNALSREFDPKMTAREEPECVHCKMDGDLHEEACPVVAGQVWIDEA